MSSEPDDEELAAVLAVLAAASAAVPHETRQDDTASIWGTPTHTHRRIRATFTAGSHGWRTSFWPR